MRWNSGLVSAAALLGLASPGLAADTSVVKDSQTGFTFSQYNAAYTTSNNNIMFRVAIPSPAEGSYDAVIQVIAPMAVGWAGLAWGGQMINCPLTIGWANGQSVVLSSRHATSHTAPTPYADAKLELLTKGTVVNGTHWQYTAKCTGCTSFAGSGGQNKTLNPAGANRLAFAYAKARPPSSSSSTTISVHDAYAYWDHDFASAGNPGFADLVAKNK
ncbi:hypothetical protein F4780DRAFT_780965 [Xylariomycetidae sp. FL0641]|nr:hypothetical protein F4780DRAFT_780965 [Xylariomycetidae sp. FL0641]